MPPEGDLLDLIDLSYQFGILRTSTFCWFEWFSIKLNRFCKILTNASCLFLQKFFYKNYIFTKKNFMLNQSSWGCFLDHLDLPYQFGILIMSTFCWNELFFTKANWIYAIWINVSLVFYESPLSCSKYCSLQ